MTSVLDLYEAIEEWARVRGDHTLIRDKTALAILTLAHVVRDKQAPVLLDEILAGAVTGTSENGHGVREAA
jgi:hypothetical protein